MNRVVKPLFGSCGRGIERIDSEAMLLPLLADAASTPEGAATYLQEFIPHPGWDVRVLLVGEEAFTLRRRSATDWRTNLARGGVGDPLVLEVNAVPGWRGLASATGLDPTPAVVRWAEQRAKQAAGAGSKAAPDRPASQG